MQRRLLCFQVLASLAAMIVLAGAQCRFNRQNRLPRPPASWVVDELFVFAVVTTFHDRSRGESPVNDIAIPPGVPTSRKNGVWDHATYILRYSVHSGVSRRFPLESHSSGLTTVSPVVPSAFESIERDDYEKQQGGTLEYVLTCDECRDINVVHDYYNGYQWNESTSRYESDGGVHIYHPTRRVVIVFDLSQTAIAGRVAGTPKLYLVETVGSVPRRSELRSEYKEGLLTAVVERPPTKSTILCDWEWTTEALAPNGRNSP